MALMIYNLILLLFFSSLNFKLCDTACARAEYETDGQCCPMCAPGNRVYRDCTEFTSTTCVPCIGATFLDAPNGLKECFHCMICDPAMGLRVQTACTRSSDTVCEPIPGHYCTGVNRGSCIQTKKHTKCQPGHYITQMGTADTDTECGKCPGGTFSNGSVHICQPHSKCESLGMKEEKPGTAESDAECGNESPVGLIVGMVFLIVVLALLVALCVYLRKKNRLHLPPQCTACVSLTPNVPQQESQGGVASASAPSSVMLLSKDRSSNPHPPYPPPRGPEEVSEDSTIHVICVYGCGQSEYLSAKGECCPTCIIGAVVLSDCHDVYSTLCRKCTDGTYMDRPNGLKQCFQCKTCDSQQGLDVLIPCTTTSNTQCGTLDGYYCKEYEGLECRSALKHRQCSPGEAIRTPGTKESDTVCEACPPGFYSPLGVNCTRWTDCSDRNELQDREGSDVEDVQCRPKPVRQRHGLIAALVLFGVLLVVSYLTHKTTRQKSKGSYRTGPGLTDPVQETGHADTLAVPTLFKKREKCGH